MDKLQEEQLQRLLVSKLSEARSQGMKLGAEIVVNMVEELENEGKEINEIIRLTKVFLDGTMDSVVNNIKEEGK